MEVIAKARYVRMSPRKVRLVADLVRGLDVAKAEAQLRFVNKAAARPVLKALQSAEANAKHNHKLEPANLYVKTITVDGGPVLSRWRARAFGRAAPIRKRTSHITIILDERVLGSEDAVKAAVVKTGKGKEKKPVATKGAKETGKSAAKKAPVVPKPAAAKKAAPSDKKATDEKKSAASPAKSKKK